MKIPQTQFTKYIDARLQSVLNSAGDDDEKLEAEFFEMYGEIAVGLGNFIGCHPNALSLLGGFIAEISRVAMEKMEDDGPDDSEATG